MREEDGDELKIRSESLLKQMHEKEKELTQCKAQIEVLENQVKVSIRKYGCGNLVRSYAAPLLILLTQLSHSFLRSTVS